MGSSTRITTNPADAEAKLATWYFDVLIISMNRQATAQTTGASGSMKRKVCDCIIIKIWSDKIVFFERVIIVLLKNILMSLVR